MNGFLTSLRRLDRVLERAVEMTEVAYGHQSADPFRGLYINLDEVKHLLDYAPGIPMLWSEQELPEQSSFEGFGITRLKDEFELCDFDLDIIILALAPELDMRYERIYAYLQDNVTRRKPSVDLALNLLCSTAEEKILRRAHFTPDSPLVKQGLINLIAEPNQIQPSLLSHFIALDEQIINLLLDQNGLDSRLTGFCELIKPTYRVKSVPLADASRRALTALTAHAGASHQQLQLYFHGPRGSGKRITAEALAFETDRYLLAADLSALPYKEHDFGKLFRILFREASFKNIILYLDEIDTLLRDEDAVTYRLLLKMLAEYQGVTVLSGSMSWIQRGLGPTGLIDVPFSIYDYDQQRNYWKENLLAQNISLDERELDTLANGLKLTPHQITSAVDSAKKIAWWNAAAASEEANPCSIDKAAPTLKDIFSASRAQTGHELAVLATKIHVKYTWDDIILPLDAMRQLRELCQRAAHRHRVLDEWGFGGKISQGKGVSALFSGPSGTGKTMAAEIIASELGLDLYKVDLSGVVSKYIGETEKNLDRIFLAAKNSNVIVLFDEADAVFGKRSEVQDSHDRYANIEISYLLQRMEMYEGITILTTNLPQNLDAAFVRRIAFSVHFPFPDEENRLRIWTSIWPRVTPISSDVDLAFLARQFKLSGGNIKNIALAASFLAAADGGEVTMEHLLRATQREYQKLGKNLSKIDLYGE